MKERKREKARREREEGSARKPISLHSGSTIHTQTVTCFYCGQITAWQNVVLFRVEREGLLDEREERERKESHTLSLSLSLTQGSNSLFCPRLSLCQCETVRLPKSFCSAPQIILHDSSACWMLILQYATCSPLGWTAMFNRMKWEGSHVHSGLLFVCVKACMPCSRPQETTDSNLPGWYLLLFKSCVGNAAKHYDLLYL